MLDESLGQNQHRNLSRLLRGDEKLLLIALLSHCAHSTRFLDEISQAQVVDMPDGGMGSVKFLKSGPRSLGVTLVKANYFDTDGVLVSIAVNADNLGELYELDLWKVDFSSLRQFPKPELVSIEGVISPESASSRPDLL